MNVFMINKHNARTAMFKYIGHFSRRQTRIDSDNNSTGGNGSLQCLYGRISLSKAPMKIRAHQLSWGL